ncbi:hypothetical protein PS862_02864 [Pseudomonas fluorescens]|uniref:Uncharacterized protein n=1 Tax=Pseudomonas fluorescens TaxID=294 RepID=A0A5E7KKA3_PSEFL|nr:hypothetical protein [Pseudomonas fluorescens]VVP01356.1 hypothetical protein PS862_02864 [Pseudomonas fluorescens]
MIVLASISGKTLFESAEITLPGTGMVQIFVNGVLGPRGRVLVLRKGADGVFYDYPELTFRQRAAVELSAELGDKLKIQFFDCQSAGIEVRQ